MTAVSRALLLTPVALTLAAAVGCKSKSQGVEIAAMDLVPDESQMAFGFQLDPIKSSALAKPLSDGIHSDPDLAPIVDALPNCEINTDGLKGVAALKLDTDDVMIVFEAPGIGDEKAMDCLEKELAKADGEPNPQTVPFETHGKIRRAPQEGGGWVVILNKNAAMILEGAWEDEVFKRIDEPDARKHSGPLGAALGRVDTNSHMWAAMQVDDSLRGDMGDVAGADGLQDIAMTVGLSDGLAVELDLEFSDGAKATEFSGAVQGMIDQTKPMIVAAGVPQAAADSIKFEAKDAIVKGNMKIDAKDVEGVANLAGSMAGG